MIFCYNYSKQFFGDDKVIFGYARPFSHDIDMVLQTKALEDKGCDRIYYEQTISPKNRPELNQLLQSINTGDQIIVYKFYSIADSTRHLIDLVQFLQSKHVHLISIIDQVDTSLEEGKVFFKLMKSVGEFQYDVLSESTKAGIYEAKRRGKNTGRPRKPDANVRRALEMYQSKKYSIAQITIETGISKTTLYRYLEEEG
ncbi:recombinase family protein [Bacillus safensis]|uniref:recombinase family protein n=1 Tax=Bacillus safensis TaxID=561879 RepID=UPI002238CB0C|nr:recombinase family protein [Bacillus safensis]MCW4645629.1 recombinase family protein [Bacillus safensis]MCY7566109.1 recombinase family protein [Bacillus safensis]MCY7624004.1 recombinase family protein [Bacillus safensis]MCY7631494.1 recombinase family protein [Bacillus safensis]MCY7648280.1 recombinase family protein [Bacillus safensis]